MTTGELHFSTVLWMCGVSCMNHIAVCCSLKWTERHHASELNQHSLTFSLSPCRLCLKQIQILCSWCDEKVGSRMFYLPAADGYKLNGTGTLLLRNASSFKYLLYFNHTFNFSSTFIFMATCHFKEWHRCFKNGAVSNVREKGENLILI